MGFILAYLMSPRNRVYDLHTTAKRLLSTVFAIFILLPVVS